MQKLKQEVYNLTQTSNTKQLKKEHPDLTADRDLRYKAQWAEILDKLKALRAEGQDLSIADLQESEKMLKQSLVKVGRLSGLSDRAIEMDWQRIQLEAQFGDIHIEEL